MAMQNHREDAIKHQLGGACVHCGSNQRLKIELAEPEPRRSVHALPLSQMEQHLDQFQLTCVGCHNKHKGELYAARVYQVNTEKLKRGRCPRQSCDKVVTPDAITLSCFEFYNTNVDDPDYGLHFTDEEAARELDESEMLCMNCIMDQRCGIDGEDEYYVKDDLDDKIERRLRYQSVVDQYQEQRGGLPVVMLDV